MPDLNKPDKPAPETEDAVPHEITDDPTDGKIERKPILPELKVSLGLREAVKLAVAPNPPERENTDMPKITAEDKIGTPMELEKTLADLRETFGGTSVIEVGAIVTEDGSLTSIRIEFTSNGTIIFWEGLARFKKGKWKLVIHPLKSDDPKWETVDNHFLELGMVRAILRHRLEKLSKHEQSGI